MGNSQLLFCLMRNQLIPRPELAPPGVAHLPLEKRIKLWEELVDESEALLLAGLKAKIGPEGDLHAAYRQWYARHMEDHDRRLVEMMENLSRREAAYSR
jgi:hypothetical protein